MKDKKNAGMELVTRREREGGKKKKGLLGVQGVDAEYEDSGRWEWKEKPPS